MIGSKNERKEENNTWGMMRIVSSTIVPAGCVCGVPVVCRACDQRRRGIRKRRRLVYTMREGLRSGSEALFNGAEEGGGVGWRELTAERNKSWPLIFRWIDLRRLLQEGDCSILSSPIDLANRRHREEKDASGDLSLNHIPSLPYFYPYTILQDN